VIAKDPEIEKIQRQITTGVTANGQNLSNYLTTWDNYCEIWEINKDAFIRRYQKLNPQVSSFDADIARSRLRCVVKFCTEVRHVTLTLLNEHSGLPAPNVL